MISPSVIFPNNGIDMSKRPDVVKGAVYSYSIQHGQLDGSGRSAVAADIKISNSSSDSAVPGDAYIAYRMKTVSGLRRARYRSELCPGAELFCRESSRNRRALPVSVAGRLFFAPVLPSGQAFTVRCGRS